MNDLILSTKNICKSFYGNKAVDDVSIEIKKGEITGLIGANGAGKTTFFNCLTGCYHASNGKIIYKDKEIQKLPPYKICKLGIARTFQIAKPFGDLSVLDNVVIGAYSKTNNKKEAYRIATETIEFLGLGSKINEFAYNLNTGDQRRLELARALATKPELLLLDEVMAGLTPSESNEMTELIRKVNENGVTILMIEHIMPVIMALSKKIYVFERGKLISCGTPVEVSNDPQVIKSYLGGSMNVRN